MKHWTMEQVAWDRFDPGKVDPEVVPLVKAAAMICRIYKYFLIRDIT